jgi:SAM-dependent methyltransferase
LIEDDSALSALDLASARLGAVRRRPGGCPAGGRSLPGARNGRRLGLNRRPFGGCRLHGAPMTREIAPALMEITLPNDAFCHERGHCWQVTLPPEIAAGDNSTAPTQSTLELFENDTPLGPAHALHDSIRNEGEGRYSHWGSELYFSSSDASEPVSSGRCYRVQAASVESTPAQLADALKAARNSPHNYPNLTSSEFDAAIDLARSTLEGILRFAPGTERGIQITRSIHRLDGLKGVMFEDQNGIFRTSPRFDEALAKHHERFRNGRAVHLELGSYIVWPAERVEKYISDTGIGDMIRLDMNLAFGPDVASNVTALPFADESIDVISSNSLFEHVAYPHDSIRECYRVLRPGGLLSTTVPFHYTAHGCPHDYLRYTGQFFEEVCTRAGFVSAMSDVWAASGPYYTMHQFLKGCAATDLSRTRTGHAAQMAHLTMLALLSALQPFDDYFDGGGPNHYHMTRMLAAKPGNYTPPEEKPDRSKPIVERFKHLICPATGLPLQREGDALISLDGAHRYPIENGIPNFFVARGFGTDFDRRASSRAQLADWAEARRVKRGVLAQLRRVLGV